MTIAGSVRASHPDRAARGNVNENFLSKSIDNDSRAS
jgi:hypothetical protein